MDKDDKEPHQDSAAPDQYICFQATHPNDRDPARFSVCRIVSRETINGVTRTNLEEVASFDNAEEAHGVCERMNGRAVG